MASRLPLFGKKSTIGQLVRITRTKPWVAADPTERLALKQILDDRLAKQPMANAKAKDRLAANRLNRKRSARNAVQRFRARLTKQKGWRKAIEPKILARRFKPNRVLDSLHPTRARDWVPILNRDRRFAHTLDVEKFSFFYDPDQALAVIAEISRAEAQHVDCRVNFLFDCEDMGPILCLAEAWPGLLPIFSGGKMTPTLQKVVEATALRRSFRMKFPELRDLHDVFAFPVRRRRPTGSSESETRDLDVQTREQVQDSFCNLMDGWLQVCGGECVLNAAGRAQFSALVGEILDNAERHSSYEDKDGAWSVGGFMVRRKVGDGFEYRCHLAFLSVGDTISESLKATAAPATAAQISTALAVLRRTAGAAQSEETLYTLLALQDGVTRDGAAFEEDRGGTGLLDVVEFVYELAGKISGAPDAEMVVISGHSCIRLRAPYIMGKRNEPNMGRRIWFNDANSTKAPPASDHVFDLKHKFPGTVISVAYTLEPEYLRTAANG